jgi:hypothetical protein
MKRKRGRPAVLSQEERLKREREKWKRKAANRRKRERDESWQQQTTGYIETIEILHWNRFVEVLVNDGWIAEEDAHVAAYIGEAVDDLLADCNLRYFGGGGYGRTRRTLGDSQGTVKVRITPEIIDAFVQAEYSRATGELPPPRKWSMADYFAKAHGTIAIHEARLRLNSYLAQPSSRTEKGQQILAALEDEVRRMEDENARLWDQMMEEVQDRGPRLDVPPEFAEPLRRNRRAIKVFIEDFLRRFYLTHIYNPPQRPCGCKLQLPVCDCLDQHRNRLVVGSLHLPGPPRPWPGPPIAKNSLYSEREPRWWRDQKTTKRHDDDKIRSFDDLVYEPPEDDQD